MGTRDDSNELKVQLAVLKERIKHFEKRDDLQQKEVERLLISLKEKDKELQKLIEERIELKIAFEVERQKTKHLEETAIQSPKKQGKKSVNAKIQGFLTSILFLIASILAGFGINMLTSVPPNSSGWLPVGMGIAAYIIAALLATFLASEGQN